MRTDSLAVGRTNILVVVRITTAQPATRFTLGSCPYMSSQMRLPFDGDGNHWTLGFQHPRSQSADIEDSIFGEQCLAHR